MITKKVTIRGREYKVASLNWAQYEEHFFDENGDSKKIPNVGAAVSASLTNAGEDAAAIAAISAGHVMQLFREVIEVSGLAGESKGEAPAATEA